MIGYKYESSKTRRQKAQFERFYRTFVASPPCVEALACSKLSTSDPGLYLKLAVERDKKGQRAPAGDKERASLSSKVHFASSEPRRKVDAIRGALRHLGAPMLPDAPDNITEWRWCTALVVTFLRRNPDLHDGVRRAHDRAFEWVGGDSILRLARKQLPPLDICPHVDVALVRQGEWRRAHAELLKHGGHTMFLPPSHVPRDAEKAESEDEGEGKTESKEHAKDVDVSADLWRARTLASIGRSRVKTKRLVRAERPYEESFDIYRQVADKLVEGNDVGMRSPRDALRNGKPYTK